jgi:RHS repeat-associated protein
LPVLELPKGGGAIRGIGEKVSTNLATGTSSVSVPIKTSPGRGGFGPSLGLSYSSGSGNGIFGLGWNLGVPSVSRRTDKKIPTYDDADTFLWGDEEELVPMLTPTGVPLVYPDPAPPPGDPPVLTCERFRPRVEGSYARIERVTEHLTGTVFWRVTTRDNLTHIFGRSEGCRISDPTTPSRVFRWLLERSYDDRGNVVEYEYKQENLAGVDPLAVFERHRGTGSCGQRHIKRIRYGNRTPYAAAPALHTETDFMFVVVFDYGDHATVSPTIAETDGLAWAHRQDPFSTHRQGFELRTRRLCQRVLMFHRITTVEPDLVAVTRFEYTASPAATLLSRAWIEGHGNANTVGLPVLASPPLDFVYHSAALDERTGAVAAEDLHGLPEGLDGSRYRWVDLDLEGIPGFLTEQGGHWFYKRNLGAGRFAPPAPLPTLPNFASFRSGAAVTDLGGDGGLQVVTQTPGVAGYFERSEEGSWEPFRAFPRPLNVSLSDPNVRLLDLDGDGLADVLVAEDEVFCWYPSKGREGYAPGRRVQKAVDEERGARIVFADGEESIHLADMSGDGLTDLVRIRNGSVVYWPNLGYGRFGAKVTMANAPRFDTNEAFHQERLRLADVDGTGTTDLLYLGPSEARLWRNHAGNRFGAAELLRAVPAVSRVGQVQVVDLLGKGTSAVVWSSPLPGDARSPLRYDDLFQGKKPYLLERVANNLGAETRFEYASSTRDYLADRAEGKPWVTKLPFPVQVVAKVRTKDLVTGSEHVASYRYHHGYYDRAEKEFRGFGMVEQTDAEDFAPYRGAGTFGEPAPSDPLHDPLLDTPPIVTKTWFHTGAWFEDQRLETHFHAHEYYKGARETFRGANHVTAARLPISVLPPDASPQVTREACRALRGRTLRTEVYANDGTDKADIPYQITEANFEVKVVESRGAHAVVRVDPGETIEFHTERDDADPRIAHSITLLVDDYGTVTQAISAVYPRRVEYSPSAEIATALGSTLGAIRAAQSSTHITYSETLVTHAPENTGPYRLGVPTSSKSFEVIWKDRPTDRFFRRSDFVDVPGLSGDNNLPYHATPVAGAGAPAFQRRLLEWSRTYYWNHDLNGARALGEIGPLALPFETRVAAFTDAHLDLIYGARIPSSTAVGAGTTRTDLLAAEGGYLLEDELWWARSGAAKPSASHFYQPIAFFDPWHVGTLSGAEVPTGTVTYDTHNLFVVAAEDLLGNTTTAEYDYHQLVPRQLIDPNENRVRVRFDALGRVVETYALGKAIRVEGDLWPDVGVTAKPGAIFSYSLAAAAPTTFSPTAPVWARALVRTTHRGELFEEAIVYSDGFGRELLTKTRVEPATVGGAARWVGSGRTVFNNKGLPVKKYEPYFSSTDGYEAETELGSSGLQGVTPVLRYDPLGRLIQTDLPDGTLTRVEFTAWEEIHHDANDLVVGSAWALERESLAATDPRKKALNRALVHRGTPTRVYLDTLARPVVSVADNTAIAAAARVLYATRVTLDVQSRQLEVFDALGRRVQWQGFDMLGRPLWTRMMDSSGGPGTVAGAVMPDALDTAVGRVLPDVAGQTLRKWTDRGYEFRDSYDAVRRLTRVRVRRRDNPAQSPSTVISPGEEWKTTEFLVYGEDAPSASDANLRGKIWQLFDQAGRVTSVAHDFKGNLLEATRTLTAGYQGTTDWSAVAEASTASARDTAAAALLSAETFATTSTFDALGRVTETNPPRSDDAARASTHARAVRNTYDRAGRLCQVEVKLGTDSAAFASYVESITYNVRGQRERLAYGNGFRTDYSYDPKHFRLTRIFTWKGTVGSEHIAQDLRYTYDPGGNITTIEDHSVTVADSQRVVRVGPRLLDPVTNEYTYDSIYRLVSATGREHPGALPTASPMAWEDGVTRTDVHPNDLAVLDDYIETYEYDAVGNFISMAHAVPSDTTHSWTRHYVYGGIGNRLMQTHGGSTTGPGVFHYSYDEHGNMLEMPRLAAMDWNAYDELSRTDNGGGDGRIEHHFQYEARGQRVRKVVEHHGLDEEDEPIITLVEERLYLGGYEVYRRHVGGDLSAEVDREVQTLHVMDGEERVALLDTRTLDMAPEDEEPEVISVDERTTKSTYQLGNHLGSACLETDEDGEVVRYAEFHPYGSTSLLASSSDDARISKRHHFAGMERDETGLQHHSARYFSPYLGRWTSQDPIGISDGVNTFCYGKCSPTARLDRTGTQVRDPGIVRSDNTSEGRAAQFIGGVLAGGIAGYLPFGAFLPEPRLPGQRTHELFQLGRGVSELSMGIAQVLLGGANLGSGGNAAASGLAAAPETGGFSLPVAAAGFGTMASGLGLIGRGFVNISVGSLHALDALSRLSDGDGTSGSVSQPASSPSAPATETSAPQPASVSASSLSAQQRSAITLPRRLFSNRFRDEAQPFRGRVLRMRSDGRWEIISSNGSSWTPRGRYIFVTRENGTIEVVRRNALNPRRGGYDPRVRHTDLASGEDVLYAGEVYFPKRAGGRPGEYGRVQSWSNGSGHYAPDAPWAPQAGLPMDRFQPGSFPPPSRTAAP